MSPEIPVPGEASKPDASKPPASVKLWPGLHPADAAHGYVRPHRDAVVHQKRDGAGKLTPCPVTILRRDHSDFHARQPGVIDRVECSTCRGTFPAAEFVWHGTQEIVGT